MLTELHLTTNQAVGCGNADDYLKALATQPYRYATPRLHLNGKTVDWLPKSGNRPTRLYPSVYDKAYELSLHLLPKLKRREGKGSAAYRYAEQVKDYCQVQGVVRYELKLKSRFLRENNYRYYGLFNERKLHTYIHDFINLDKRLQVAKMDIQTISEQLLASGAVRSAYSANITTLYALQWLHGKRFDLSKASTKRHRARLRKIGIDRGRSGQTERAVAKSLIE